MIYQGTSPVVNFEVGPASEKQATKFALECSVLWQDLKLKQEQKKAYVSMLGLDLKPPYSLEVTAKTVPN